MKHLPRVLNRFLLFIIGLICAALGVGLVLLATWAKAAEFWQRQAGLILERYSALTKQTRTIFNPDISWLTIAFAAATVMLILFLLWWIFRQGGGSTKNVDFEESTKAQGTTVASLKFIDALVNDVIEDDKWIASVKTQGWKVKRQNGLSIKIVTLKGAEPEYLKNKMDEVLARLDSALGREVPVCIHMTTGWRTSISSPGRVDK